MGKIAYLSTIVFLLIFSSCLRDEEPINPQSNSGRETIVVEMKSDYSIQTWFDLSAQEEVYADSRTNWDVSFELANNLVVFKTNSANVGGLAITTEEDLTQVTESTGYSFFVDGSSGIADSLAMAKCGFEFNRVYIYNRGFAPDGTALGYVKLKFEQVANQTLMKYAELSSSDEQVVYINEATTYYSFNTNAVISTIPSSTQFDLLFTNYTYEFYNPYLPYSVTGVLISPDVQGVAVDSLNRFDELTLAEAENLSFSTNSDAIGYGWKYFSLDQNLYTTFSSLTYIVKDRFGYYHKLRFIDFYNTQGEKGYPAFEVERLS